MPFLHIDHNLFEKIINLLAYVLWDFTRFFSSYSLSWYKQNRTSSLEFYTNNDQLEVDKKLISSLNQICF